jgi:hypothetical protein
MLLCVKQGFLEYQTLLISESQENNKYKIICSLSKCQFIVTKQIAAELRNIGGNFLPPKIYQNCEHSEHNKSYKLIGQL